jgi:hypothetical protein
MTGTPNNGNCWPGLAGYTLTSSFSSYKDRLVMEMDIMSRRLRGYLVQPFVMHVSQRRRTQAGGHDGQKPAVS